MKSLFSILAFVLLAYSTVAQEGSRSSSTNLSAKDLCSLSGLVVKMAGSEPLKNASVQLVSNEDREHTIATKTDSSGRFELRNVPPGRYQLKVTRNGYVAQEYGQKTPNDPGSILSLSPGKNMTDLVFRLVPSAVIAGRILDEDGEPMPWAMVSALREIYSEGKRKLSTETTVSTNDLGEFRLFGLKPGRYFVSALYRPWNRVTGEKAFTMTEPGNAEQGLAKMYYPGTPDSSKATTIAVKSGEEISGMDILMRQVLVYRIRGRVFNSITHKPGAGVMLDLSPKASRLEWDFGGNFSHVNKQDGSFEIGEVLPGSYMLTAFWFDEGKAYSARVPVEVGNTDVEGVSLTIAPGTSVVGRVVWDGPASMKESELRVMLQSVDSSISFTDDARVSANNTFSIKEVPDGMYRVEVYGKSKDCYVKDVQYGGSSGLEEGFNVVRGGSSTLEITLSSRGARIQGTVLNSDHLPVAGVWVVLVPDAPRRSQFRLYREVTTDQYGRFDIHGVAPGDYKLFSWEEVESKAWEDPEFLKPFEDKGEKISVQENDQKTANLTSIRTKAPDEKEQ